MEKRDAVSLIKKLPYKSDVKKKFAAEVKAIFTTAMQASYPTHY